MKIFIGILFLLLLVEYICKYVSHEIFCYLENKICQQSENETYVCIREGDDCYSLHYCEYELEDCSKGYISLADEEDYACERDPNTGYCH